MKTEAEVYQYMIQILNRLIQIGVTLGKNDDVKKYLSALSIVEKKLEVVRGHTVY